ncbi:hypothetical protein [Acetobacter sp.]|uniref:hypothetical protein n=1 Tax=Acetobacter sp. TaxID=440 RepID=UPI0039EADC56
MKRYLAALCVMTSMTGAAFADNQTGHADRQRNVVQHVNDARASSQNVVQSADAKSCVKVWVNPQTHVYHMPGSFWYGATQNGHYMCMQQAVASGNTRAFF